MDIPKYHRPKNLQKEEIVKSVKSCVYMSIPDVIKKYQEARDATANERGCNLA